MRRGKHSPHFVAALNRAAEDDEPFLDAVLAFFESGEPMTVADRQEIVKVIRRATQPAQKKGRGRPKSDHLRWENPAHVAAWLAELLMKEWKETHDRLNVPGDVHDELVDQSIELLSTSKAFEGWGLKERDKLRVLEILHDAKHRRLPSP